MAGRTTNLWHGIGRVGKDPDLRYSEKGTAVVKFSIAIDRQIGTDEDGKPKKVTDWFNLVAFGKAAEVYKEIARKGAMVSVVAQLQPNKYEVDGEARYGMNIVIQNLDVLVWPKRENDGAGDTSGDDTDDDAEYGTADPDNMPF